MRIEEKKPNFHEKKKQQLRSKHEVISMKIKQKNVQALLKILCFALTKNNELFQTVQLSFC